MNNKYLSGLFDAEGCVQMGLCSNSELAQKIGVSPALIIAIKNEYFSGLFDGDGSAYLSLSVSPHKHLDVAPRLKIKLKNGEELLRLICKKYGGTVSEQKKSHMIIWQIHTLSDVERVTDVLLQHCIIKRPQLLLLKYVVIPTIKNKEHLTREGMLKLIEIHEQLNQHGGKSKLRKDWRKILDTAEPRRPLKRFTKEEDAFITNNWQELSDEKIANKLGRLKGSIQSHRKHVLKLYRRKKSRPFTQIENKFIKNNYLHLSDLAIGKKLGRGQSSVRHHRIHALKLIKPSDGSRRWLFEFLQKRNVEVVPIE